MSVRPQRTLQVLGVLGPELTGVSYARFVQPFSHLREHGFELRTLDADLRLARGPSGWTPDPVLLEGVDLLMFPQTVAAPRLADGSHLELGRPLCESARERGIPIAHSIDDYLPAVDPGHANYETLAAASGNLEAILDGADAWIVTTDRLKETLARRGKPIHVLPNTVDRKRWETRPRRSDRLRVGWCGSSSHVDDLAMVLPAIGRLQRRVPCRFVVHGLVDMPLSAQRRAIERDRGGYSPAQRETAERFLELLHLLDGLDFEHVPFVPTDAYFGTLPALDLDIGIAPLVDNVFNRHKSALKFYEYAITGSLTVASDVEPYRGEVSLTCPNEPGAWAELLERYLTDESERDAELERQREYVLAEREIGGWREAWAAALRSIAEPAREERRVQQG